MDISATWLLLNAAYAVYAVSGIFKDMLKLRVVLIVATVFFILYGIFADVWSAVWWNLPVGILHSWHVNRLLRARRGVALNDESRAVQLLLFPDLNAVEFHAFWQTGTERTVANQVLIAKGNDVKELLLIIDGQVNVDVSDTMAVRLGRTRFVGEMSMLNAAPASATVTAQDEVRYRAWDRQALKALFVDYPQVELALLKAMGQEVARKLS